ncbi:MAG: hypothetical protein R3Y63_09795 [Eubacteriales bacterium]
MEQFRSVDMILFSAMAVIAGVLSDVYLVQLDTGFYYSLKTVVCLIFLIRWGKYGVIPIMVASIGSIVTSGYDLITALCYFLLADVFLALPVILYGKRNRDLLVSTFMRTIGYVVVSHSTLSLGKGLAILLVEGEFTGAIGFFVANFMVICMDCVVMLILKTIDELIIDIENSMTREGTANGESNGQSDGHSDG